MPPRPPGWLDTPRCLRYSYRSLHATTIRFQPRSRPAPSPLQRNGQDDYYSLLLAQPLATTAPTTFSPPSLSNHPSQSQEPRRDPSVIFGTPLAGPSAARRRAGYGEKPYATGGLERPREPDNCCMSGCVNCVWDAYREEVEAWALRRREALKADGKRAHDDPEEMENKANKMRRKNRTILSPPASGQRGESRVDEVWREADSENEKALFEGVPVGIREFMATEKKLKEKRGRVG